MKTELILLAAVFIVSLIFERLRPLRPSTRPKMKRVMVNLAIGASGVILLKFFFFPVTLPISLWVSKNHIGLLYMLPSEPILQFLVSLLLMDYTLWIWHWLNHNVPFLWRFHNVHHIDLELDVSTASRFHFGELAISLLFRSAQVVLLGIDPLTLLTYETATTLAAQFHHSNISYPIHFERMLNKFFVTPRMHGIHHSIVQQETDSNYSTIFPFWDRIHGTLRLDIPQSDITIGVPAYRIPEETGLLFSLLLPFKKQRPWKIPTGKVP